MRNLLVILRANLYHIGSKTPSFLSFSSFLVEESNKKIFFHTFFNSNIGQIGRIVNIKLCHQNQSEYYYHTQ